MRRRVAVATENILAGLLRRLITGREEQGRVKASPIEKNQIEIQSEKNHACTDDGQAEISTIKFLRSPTLCVRSAPLPLNLSERRE